MFFLFKYHFFLNLIFHFSLPFSIAIALNTYFVCLITIKFSLTDSSSISLSIFTPSDESHPSDEQL
jgi:hypothetical protein